MSGGDSGRLESLCAEKGVELELQPTEGPPVLHLQSSVCLDSWQSIMDTPV